MLRGMTAASASRLAGLVLREKDRRRRVCRLRQRAELLIDELHFSSKSSPEAWLLDSRLLVRPSTGFKSSGELPQAWAVRSGIISGVLKLRGATGCS